MDRHLKTEQIQAFLDGSLPKGEQETVREHASLCARCQSEFEAWELLYSELEELPALAPSSGFAMRVMDQVVIPSPSLALGDRLRSWMGRTAGAVVLTPEIMQDYLDGSLAEGQMARVATQIAESSEAQQQLSEWQAVFGGLGSLGHEAPSESLHHRIMAQVRVHQLMLTVQTPTTTWERMLVLGRAVMPRTQKAWAVVSGIAVTPASVVVLMVYAIFTSSSMTPMDLLSFGAWKARDALSALGNGALAAVTESPQALQLFSSIGALTSSPLLAIAGVLTFAVLSGVALWVLYRNLFATQTVDGKTYA